MRFLIYRVERKRMAQDGMVSNNFSLRHNWWFDAELAGSREVRDKFKGYTDIRILATDRHLTLQAPSSEILRNYLEDCYSTLMTHL